ncbi:DUF2493 domain-containing protein [Cryptosporangium phraense]|uniref:DUF2493 domain-containing protein n=1 Tax=Cryptosporangium phraense TaxID=2593070 RepID=A0A545AQY2_9ACTN|nr:DUF2493 domain-containing protein [Cryptosporangium phraense]TQS43742.1 DUF2493 domain-containing protein [Cryptosporangium phraense]
MRILVTGSRTWTDARTIATTLDRATDGHPGPHILVHGGARGADTIAATLAGRRGWQVEAHPADWPTCAPDCRPGHRRTRYDGATYCPTAGHRRNAAMVAAGADLCLAFIRANSTGACHCANLAETAGIPVLRRITYVAPGSGAAGGGRA